MSASFKERIRRWYLALGGDEQPVDFSKTDTEIERALTALYAPGGQDNLNRSKRGGSEKSAPTVTRWLGDIRKYFPSSVVQVMQKDAFERLKLHDMLLQPEMLNSVQPDVHLVALLVSLNRVIPASTRETARMVVRKVVNELMQKLDEPLRSAIRGALNRAERNHRPRHNEIDWHRTIQTNLKHWQPTYKTIIPERLVGYGRKARRTQREIILCIDQSGSMASSVVYSSIFGAVMASLPAVSTRLVVFDTAVVDMTERLDDPTDLLFGVQLGGGTNINQAIGYCQSLIREPQNTILVLISDLIEGGVATPLLRRVAELTACGVQFISLLALSDEGAPAYDHELAAQLAAMGVPSFACTPDHFPALMAAAIQRSDIGLWASQEGIVSTRA